MSRPSSDDLDDLAKEENIIERNENEEEDFINQNNLKLTE